jgi:hypothetical protein
MYYVVFRAIVVTPRCQARASRMLARAWRVPGACLTCAWRVRVRGKCMHGALVYMVTY